jgi:hypothetical protein
MHAFPDRRHLRAIGTLAALGLASSTLAQAAATPAPAPKAKPLPAAGGEVRSWYLRNEVGGNFIPAIGLADRSVVVGPDVVSTRNASLSMDAGIAWNIAGGWRITDTIAIEVSSGLASNGFSHVTGNVDVNGTSGSGSLDVAGNLLQVPVLAGARLELPVARDFWLNLGASIGGNYLGATIDSISGLGTTFPVGGSDGAWAFAYSATLGFEWDLSADVGLGLAYRFLGTTSATFGPNGLIGAEGIYNQHVLATLTLRF